MSVERPYRGVAADLRRERRRVAFLEAALGCLGEEESDLTVRSVCTVAKLNARYFYESFENLDELKIAVFSQIADEVALRAAQAVDDLAQVELDAACRTAFEAAYSVFQDDPRKARAALLVASGTEGLTEARRRVVLAYADVMLDFLGQQVGGGVDSVAARASVLFAVGGVLEVTHAALIGDLDLEDDALVDLAGGLLASSVRQILEGAAPA